MIGFTFTAPATRACRFGNAAGCTCWIGQGVAICSSYWIGQGVVICSSYWIGQGVVIDRTRCPVHSPLTVRTGVPYEVIASRASGKSSRRP